MVHFPNSNETFCSCIYSRPGGVVPQSAPPPQVEQESEDDKFRDVQPKTYQVLEKEVPHSAATGTKLHIYMYHNAILP